MFNRFSVIPKKKWMNRHKIQAIKSERLVSNSEQPCNEAVRAFGQRTGFKGFWRWPHRTATTEVYTFTNSNSKSPYLKAVQTSAVLLSPSLLPVPLYSALLTSYDLNCLLSRICTLTHTLFCPFSALWKVYKLPKD